MNRVALRVCRPLTLIVALAFALGSGRTAAAQTAPTPPAGSTTTTVFNPGNWTVTPFVGIGFSGDLDSGAGAFGAAAGYVWNQRISLEGELNILPSSENNGVIEVGTHSWTLTANALYHFNGRTWIPYGVFGLGLGHGGADINSTGVSGLSNFSSGSTEFVANLGGGVERRITDRMAFRGDLRYQFGGNFVPNYWRLAAGVTFNVRTR